MTRHISIFDALTVGAYDDVRDMSVVFFSPAFLISPNPGWRVCGEPRPTAFGEPRPTAFGDPTREPGELAQLYGQQLDDVFDAWSACRYAYRQDAPGVQKVNVRCDRRLQGTLVKLTEPQRVWVLTGHRDLRTGYYEGQWPD
jgi:hypothetical protein